MFESHVVLMTKLLAKKVSTLFVKLKGPFEPNLRQIGKKALLLLNPSIVHHKTKFINIVMLE